MARVLLKEDGITRESDGYLGFTLAAPSAGFSAGDYQLELYMDGKQKAEVPFTIQRDSSESLPTINFFTAQPPTLVSGQACRLDWKVTNASRISIEPNVGVLTLEGNKGVSPVSDTTYTLWAVNRNGCSSNSLSVRVSKPVTGKSKLEICDFWTSGNFISYRIKNTGNLASCSTETYLYRNDLLECTDFVTPLQPGEERIEQFGRYHFSPRFPFTSNLALTETTGEDVNVRVCANGGAACPDTCNTSSCIEHNFGMLLNVDLLQYTSTAQWDCSKGMPIWAISPGINEVIGRIPYDHLMKDNYHPDSLLVSPPRDGGWLQCVLGVPGADSIAQQPFFIPHKCKFSSRVGITDNAPDSAHLKFTLGTAQGNKTNYFPSVTVTKGKSQSYEVDLSQLAGQKVEFILRVESTDPLPQGSAVWAEPFLIQQQ